MHDDPSHGPPSSVWWSLRSLAAADASLAGSKASGLARGAAAGLPTAPGWVLPVAATARLAPGATTADPRQGVGELAALRFARELLSLAPDVSHWILRSSSPWEDRAGASAAGLLSTEIATAVPEALAAGLMAVVASGQAVAVRALLQAPHGVPVAVLAQPLMQFTAWWTLEVRPADSVLLVDGWRADDGVPRPVVAQLPWSEVASPLRPGTPQSDAVTSGVAPSVLALARAVVRAWGAGDWQLEVGERDGTALLLQVRPAPAAFAPLPEPHADALPTAPPAGGAERDDVPRFPLHPGDDRSVWRWDLEHCPTPLCPLLAGWFARWLADLPATHPSRLIQGRWHDRQTAIPPTSAPREPANPWPVPAEIRSAVTWWEDHGAPALLASLGELAERARELADSHGQWPAFMARWLAFQREYFDAPQTAAARAWAREVRSALQHHDPPIAPPPLPETEADQRERDLRRLAQELASALAVATVDPAPHRLEQLLARPATARLRAVAEAIAAHRRRFAHEAVSPWDGRGVCLEEDASPLYRELARRIAASFPPAGPRSQAASPRELDGPDRVAGLAAFEVRLTTWIADPVQRSQVREAALLASRVLGWAEDDDALLARSYALFRRAARTVARISVDVPLAEREVFEVLPGDLEAQIRTRDVQAWRAAVRRGRALAAMWEAHAPGAAVDPQGVPASSGLPGEQRRGLAAAPGRAVGPPRRVAYAQQDGGPMPGDVLVVPTLLPHDAVVLGRVAAVIVEAGSPLGHAAVLAREHGVPAVVALPGALRWLATAERVLVDGDAGSVTILAPRSPHAAPNG